MENKQTGKCCNIYQNIFLDTQNVLIQHQKNTSGPIEKWERAHTNNSNK